MAETTDLPAVLQRCRRVDTDKHRYKNYFFAQADRALGSALADPLEAEDPPLAGKILSYPW